MKEFVIFLTITLAFAFGGAIEKREKVIDKQQGYVIGYSDGVEQGRRDAADVVRQMDICSYARAFSGSLLCKGVK